MSVWVVIFFRSDLFTIGWAVDMYTKAIYAFNLIFYIAFESSLAFFRSCHESAPNSFKVWRCAKTRVWAVNFLKVVILRSDGAWICIRQRFLLSIWSFTLFSNYRLRFSARAMNRRQIVSRCGGVQKCVYESWILAAIRSINWVNLVGYMEGERILPFFGMVSITIFTPCVRTKKDWIPLLNKIGECQF